MKKQNFFSWYYTRGLEEFLEIVKNLLHFFWRYFSIAELFRTLFYPWKRDIATRYWRGFRPFYSLAAFTDNLFSRLIGAVARSLVIITGIFIAVCFFAFSLALILIWLFPPLILSVFLLNFFAGFFSFPIFLVFFAAHGAVVFTVYRQSNKPRYFQMEISELVREKWFNRVWERMGKSEDDLARNISENPDLAREIIESANMTISDLEKILTWEIKLHQQKGEEGKFWIKSNLEKIVPLGSHWKYAYTVNLDKYSIDLSQSDFTDYNGKDLIGRRNELSVAEAVLARPGQNNVLIVGDSGIGKTTLVHYLAKLARSDQAAGFLKNKRVLIFDLGRMIADAVSEGKDAEEELHLIFQEASYAGNVILVISDIENYLGKENRLLHPDVSFVMNDYLSLPTFQIIATSNPKEYHLLVEKRENFMKYFEAVELGEPSEEETLEILHQNFEKYEKQRVIFTYPALKHIISSSGKYRWDVPLPERALDLAEEVFMYWRANPESSWITPETTDRFLALKTGAPQGEIREDERKKLLDLEKIIHRRIIGQEDAVRQLAEALRRARSGISNPQRPIGSFLFLGPTGVGKTETAKALAEGYFGDEEKMIRLDMSEFQSPLSIDRLIGSAQLNQPGQLVNKAKDHPFSLLLLDELEKAYPEILNLFLQILDEGFVTDAFGEKVNFRNMIIIATSNAGSSLIKKMMEEGNSAEEIKKNLIDYVVNNNIFRIEFLNRFDGIIFFRPLNPMELRSVAGLMLRKLARRMKKEKNIEITFDEQTVGKIIESGYDPIFGARSLYRFIEDKVENLIARKIIAGEAKKGEKILISSGDFAAR